MSDLISRQDALDALKGFDVDIIPYEHGKMYVQETLNAIHHRLSDLPSAEPERKKGKWIDGNGKDTYIHCSICYEEAYWDSDYGQQTFGFCPYCGADLRGER